MSRSPRPAPAARRAPSTGRARPLPVEERRLVIVETATAMLRRDGAMPTTRRLAQECGIAEGTIFRAFPTKDALVDALLSTVGCPYPFRESVRALAPEPVPTADGLRSRLLGATALLHARFVETFETLVPLGWMGPPPHHPHPGCPADREAPAERDFHLSALREILAPYGPLLAVDVDVLVDAMRFLAFSGAHRHLNPHRGLSPEVIVDLLLDGALAAGPDVQKEHAC